MADFSKMSDAELMALVQPQAAAKDYSKMSDEELMGVVQPSTAKDAYKSFDAGVAKGTSLLLGSPGDLTNIGAKGIGIASDWINDKLGLPKYEQPKEKGPVAAFLERNLPNSAGMEKEIQSRYYGGEKPYEPITPAGRYARKIGEFAASAPIGPGGLVAKTIATVGGGVGAEGGGDAAEELIGPDARPYGEILGGVAGAMSPSALGRVVTPLPASPQRQRLVDILNNEGVTSLTAGQRTGNKSLQFAESFLGDGPLAGQGASRIQQRGQEQFTEAAMRRAGGGADAAPEALAANNTRLSNQFEELSARNVLTPDNQFITDLTTAVRDYRNVPNSQQRAIVQGYVDDIVGHVNAGQMSGAQYQEMRSRLSRQSNGLRVSDPTLSDALRDMRNALDDAMGRSIPAGSADHALWNQSRREWGAQKTIEKTASRAGEATAEGQLVPANLRNTVSANNRGAYARGEGDFSELARAGAGVMAPLPNSGTAQRNALTNLLMLPVSATAGRAITSRPVQAYLGNQVLARQLEQLPPGRQAVVRAMLAMGRPEQITGPSR